MLLEITFLFCFREGDADNQNDTPSGEPSPTTSEAQQALQAFWPKVMEDIKKFGTICNVCYTTK